MLKVEYHICHFRASFNISLTTKYCAFSSKLSRFLEPIFPYLMSNNSSKVLAFLILSLFIPFSFFSALLVHIKKGFSPQQAVSLNSLPGGNILLFGLCRFRIRRNFNILCRLFFQHHQDLFNRPFQLWIASLL